MYLYGDPERDADARDAEQTAWLERRPVCCVCGEHIQEDWAIHIDEKWYCEECEDVLWDKLRDEWSEEIIDE